MIESEPIDLLAAVRQSLGARRLDGDIELRGDTVSIRSDRRRLDRMLGNLAENAVHHGGGPRACFTMRLPVTTS